MLSSTEIPSLVRRINAAAWDRGHLTPIVRQFQDMVLVTDVRALTEICEAAPLPERPQPGPNQLAFDLEN